MPEGEQHWPFTEAFNAWFASAVDLHDIIAFEPCEDRDAVEIGFLVGDGALHGYAHPAGISISIMRGHECWDFIFDHDVVAEKVSDGWLCTLCPIENRPYFPSIEALWAEHLIEPLAEWLRLHLKMTLFLALYQAKGNTWARLLPHRPNPDEEKQYLVELIELHF